MFGGFGATTPSTSFGAAPTGFPSFGGGSTASTSGAGLFGGAASTPPAFGAAASAPSLAFGALGTTQFGTSTPSTGAFGATTFGAAPKPLGGFPSTPSVGVGMFGATPTSQFGASPLPGQQQPQVQITHLATRDRRPVTYGTKVEDLDDASRALLQELEKKVKQHREHKRQLETFERVQATGAGGKKLRDELDMEVHVLSKKVQGLLSMLKADKQNLDSLYQVCLKLVRRTEALSNASQRLKLRQTAMQQAQGASGYGAAAAANLPGDLGFRPPATPSPFLLEALANFELAFDQMGRVVSELEQLHMGGHRSGAGAVGSEIRGLLLRGSQGAKEGEEVDQSMSKILDNFVVYFNHVLSQYSKVSARLHEAKKDFNKRQKGHGVDRDYFAEADRKAVAAEERLRKEAEQKKQQQMAAVNPQQPPQQPPQQLQQQQQPSLGLGFGAPAATPGLFSTPQATPALGQSASLFSPSTFGAQPAATPGLFGAPQPANPLGATSFGQSGAFGAGPAGSGSKSKSKSKRGK